MKKISIKEDGDIIKMSVADWASIPNNPRQREIEKRARSSRGDHLRQLKSEHRDVHMGLLPDGSMIKIDGHTRLYMWQNDMTNEVPENLRVHVWLCESLEEAKDRYLRHDSRRASESPRDALYGACREVEFEPQSSYLKGFGWSSSVRIAENFLTKRDVKSDLIYYLVDEWRDQLQMFDDLLPKKDRFLSGVTAGALLSFLRYGESAASFWDAYNMDQGTKLGNERDAVQALSMKFLDMRARGLLSHNTANAGFVPWVLAAVDTALEGRIYKGPSGYKPLQTSGLGVWNRECLRRREAPDSLRAA